MILRQLFDYDTWTYTYLVGDTESGAAVLIDPVLGQIERDMELLSELGLILKYALDTHVHADHITANGKLRDLTACQTGIAAINAVGCADLALNDGDILPLGKEEIRVISTPGHTSGCLSFLIGSCVFTGDSLFIRGSGRTDFQQGDAGLLYDSITRKLYTLPKSTRVYPGHDYHGRTLSTIAEEMEFNPRLKLGRDSFMAYMEGLDLPDPRLIMEAVPANQSCGRISVNAPS